MPRTSIVDSDKAKAAVSVLIRAPGITVREAMILAKFTEEEANTKSMQRKVSRDLQKTNVCCIFQSTIVRKEHLKVK